MNPHYLRLPETVGSQGTDLTVFEECVPFDELLLTHIPRFPKMAKTWLGLKRVVVGTFLAGGLTAVSAYLAEPSLFTGEPEAEVPLPDETIVRDIIHRSMYPRSGKPPEVVNRYMGVTAVGKPVMDSNGDESNPGLINPIVVVVGNKRYLVERDSFNGDLIIWDENEDVIRFCRQKDGEVFVDTKELDHDNVNGGFGDAVGYYLPTVASVPGVCI